MRDAEGRVLCVPEREAHRLEEMHPDHPFGVPGGRCEACQGEGEVRVEMQFLADVFVPCESCSGTRFKREVLDVRVQGKSIHDVLDLTVSEAIQFFAQIGESQKLGDKLEMIVADDLWPLPTYREMLFIR